MIDLYRIGIIIVTVTPLLSCEEFSKKESVLKDNSIDFNKFTSSLKMSLSMLRVAIF
ncbi:TPA: hypothetical protein ACNFPD_004353 [Enterobacter cancerogenus]|jgi:hypothetical protein|uniref:hypothetical protein n=1 Tax=Enterobacter TaxID=547 RepID=UPI0001826FC8|nr:MULTISPECIES: hypothetical protein [Enterobacter]EFC54675.1 hypothetical protein ENTCAN_08600 [Enterobacter cancerogenus ATCC 35316]MDI3428205.1 hypothetical protein [Enterobacter sp. V87_3]